MLPTNLLNVATISHYQQCNQCENEAFLIISFLNILFVLREALNVANKYLSSKHGIVRLDNVWGIGGGTRPVKQLIKKVRQLVFKHLW